MKRKIQSACVEDVDPKTEEVIQGTQNSASIYPPAEESRERRKAWRKSGQHLYECRDSEDLGPVLEFISNYKGQDILTIIAGKHDDNKAVWAEYDEVSKNSSTKQRIIHLQDDIINGESKTYTVRAVPISQAYDLSAQNPSIILVKRTICPKTSRILLTAHHLHFGPSIDLNRPYIFTHLGDELPGLNSYPDLHITFRCVRDWDSVLRRWKFVGFDRNVVIDIKREEVRSGKQIVYDLAVDHERRVDEEEGRPECGIAVDAGQFRALLVGHGERVGGQSSAYPSPPGKKRRVEETSPRSFCLKIIGAGPEIKGNPFKADLNVNFVLKP